MIKNISVRRLLAAMIICVMMLAILTACDGSGGADVQQMASPEQIQNHYNEQLDELYSAITVSLPADYTVNVAPAGGNTVSDSSVAPAVSGSDISEADRRVRTFVPLTSSSSPSVLIWCTTSIRTFQ